MVLVHGFSSCLLEFGDLPERLGDAGFAALAIDLRGHGLSGGERGRIGLERAMADIGAAADFLRERLGRKARLGVVGHSLGGAFALGTAARSTEFSCIVAAHPPDSIFDELNPAERALYHALGAIGKRRMHKGRAAGMFPRRPVYRHLFVDKEAARRAARQRFLAESVNVGNYSFATTMRTTQWAAHLNVPVLGIQSDHDQVVRPDHTEEVFRSLPGPVERLRHRGGHSCFLDLDRDLVGDGVIRFLRAHLERA